MSFSPTRRSGILLHPLSLPGSSACGELDESIDAFLDFCKNHHQSIWQVLPLGPTGYGDSPYQSFSTHAGNPYLISIKSLVAEGLATKSELKASVYKGPSGKIDYGFLYETKRPILAKIAASFQQRSSKKQKDEFAQFCEEEKAWLDDYALFMALKDQREKSWQEWPKALRGRQAKALEKVRKDSKQEILSHRVLQWFFFKQWEKVKLKAKQRGIQVLGDIPIFVALDSADAWSAPKLFQFDKESRPTAVAGVPPDYFSKDGQLWGNPLYNWPHHQKTGFRWWVQRIESALKLYDLIRIDHFRGFCAYWSVPAKDKTARNGHWVEAPGDKLFTKLQKTFSNLPVIAEDLGDITPDVHALRNKFELPGMKVLQFAFSDPKNNFLPHNFERDFVVYTGTHDNDTTLGWCKDPKRKKERRYFCHYLGLPEKTDNKKLVEQMVRLAMRSVAETVIIPFQDLLKKDSKSRMNIPSKASGNWQWRMTEKELKTKQDWLLESTWISGRKT